MTRNVTQRKGESCIVKFIPPKIFEYVILNCAAAFLLLLFRKYFTLEIKILKDYPIKTVEFLYLNSM